MRYKSHMFRASFLNFAPLILFLLLPVLLVTCMGRFSSGPGFSSVSADTVDLPNADADEYAVYDALIESNHSQYAAIGRNFIAIRGETSAYSLTDQDLVATLRYIAKKGVLGEIPSDVEADFLKKNKDAYPLTDRFKFGMKHVLKSPTELKQVAERGGWNEFYQKYPESQGIIILSRVGFNRTMDRAEFPLIEQQISQKASYETVGSMKAPNGQNMLIVLIAVPPADFARDPMTRLARQLNEDFKDEQWVHAAIFDSPDAAKNCANPRVAAKCRSRETIIKGPV